MKKIIVERRVAVVPLVTPRPHLRAGDDTGDKRLGSESQTKPSPQTTGWEISSETYKFIVKRWMLKPIAEFM